MKNKAIVWTLVGVGLVLVCTAVYFTDPAQRREPPVEVLTDKSPDETYCAEPNQVVVQTEPNEVTSRAEPNELKPQTASVKDTFKDEPEAHALYEKMIETMRNAESLSYKGDCGNCTYTIWMKKPNYFRVETVNRQGVECGTLVGDGDHLWIYWPEGNAPSNDAGDNIYMKRAPENPSTFHGYTDSLEPYLDGAKSWYTESIDGHECDVIEVSFMNRQRIWYLWLSKEDHLPRKLKEVVRVSRPLVGYEYWSDVKVNAEIPDEKFAWAPPAGWVQWTPPELDDELLKPGTEAPDFELLLADETKARLSDYRGRIVWFYMWRVG